MDSRFRVRATPLKELRETPLNELRETRFWLRLALRAGLVARPDTLCPPISETSQWITILTASTSTAKVRSARRG